MNYVKIENGYELNASIVMQNFYYCFSGSRLPLAPPDMRPTSGVYDIGATGTAANGHSLVFAKLYVINERLRGTQTVNSTGAHIVKNPMAWTTGSEHRNPYEFNMSGTYTVQHRLQYVYSAGATTTASISINWTSTSGIIPHIVAYGGSGAPSATGISAFRLVYNVDVIPRAAGTAKYVFNGSALAGSTRISSVNWGATGIHFTAHSTTAGNNHFWITVNIRPDYNWPTSGGEVLGL